MKKGSFLICFILFLAYSLFAQDDSSKQKNIIVKINPTLIGTAILSGAEGERGVIIQFPVKGRLRGTLSKYRSIDAFIGFGYNQNSDTYTNAGEPNATGYTIRGGFYFYREKKYLSVQFSFRTWNIKGIYDVYGQDPVDNIISPSTAISDFIDMPFYSLENAIVNVYSADIVYGNQFPHQRKSGRLFFEWFVGTGLRFKTIKYEELGTYNPNASPNSGFPVIYYPLSTPNYSSETKLFPDFKLGIMVGIIL
jgi:hypothetical protein